MLIFFTFIATSRNMSYNNTTPCPEKKGATLFLPVTLRNANRFSKFFYHHTLQYICSKGVNKYPARFATLPCKTFVLKNRKLHRPKKGATRLLRIFQIILHLIS